MLFLLLHLDFFITSQPLFWLWLLRLRYKPFAFRLLLLIMLLCCKIANIFIIKCMTVILLLCYWPSFVYHLLKLIAQVSSIFTLVHFINDFLPLPVFDLRRLNSFRFLTNFFFALQRILLPQNLSEHVGKAIFNMSLNKSKFFITFVL